MSIRKRTFLVIFTSIATICLIASSILLFVSFRKDSSSIDVLENSSQKPNGNVLMLGSNHTRFSMRLQEAGIQSVFLKNNINLDITYFDTNTAQDLLVDYFNNTFSYKTSLTKYDAILISGDMALDYISQKFEENPLDIPVIFFNTENQNRAVSLAERNGFYGVVENFFISETLELAEKMLPEAKSVTAIYDNSPMGYNRWIDFLSSVSSKNSYLINGINSSDISRNDMKYRLKHMKKNSIVIYLSAINDVYGNHYTPDEQVDFIAEFANTPIFAYSSIGLGRGVIGGKIPDIEKSAALAASLVKMLIDGEEIPRISKISSGRFCFDYRTLEKFNIEQSLIPAHSIKINKQGTYLSDYKLTIIAFIGIIFSLVTFLFIAAALTVSESYHTRELKDSHSKMEYMVEHDYLTKLPNRFKASDVFNKLVDCKKDFAVILIDIDDFKNINDFYSHSCGDEVLRSVASRLLSLMVDGVFFASRFGGDEFLVLYTQGHISKDSDDLKKLSDIFKEPVYFDGKKITVQASIGIANSTQDDETLDEMVASADISMYHSKRNGKNQFTFFNSDMKDLIKSKNEILKILENAIENDGIQVLFQPQLDATSNEIHGYEALMRLKDVPISPAKFVPIAEENGLIVKIDRIVTEKVIQQMAEWKARRIPLHKVSINYSYGQIEDVTYVDFLEGLLRQYDISPSYIGIEITEGLFIANKEKAMELFNSFAALGISIALDDFGTGYSSLSYLTYLPIDVVKIDKSLVDNYLNTDRDVFIKNIVRLVHSLDMKLTVEGVETEWQFEKLKNFRCDYIQGYYYSKPITGKEIEVFIEKYAKHS